MIFQIREGLQYNPYFPGGAIAMPKMLNDGAMEYEDGTPATEAQVCLILCAYKWKCLNPLCEDWSSSYFGMFWCRWGKMS